jgi:hypothetical protein
MSVAVRSPYSSLMSCAYLAEGKRPLAKKDLEPVLAEDGNCPELQLALTQLDAT